MAFVDFLDHTSLMRDIIDRRPDRLADFLKLAHDVLRGTSDLSVGERELIGAFVSGLNDCTYCYGAHSATAARFGIDTSLFDTLMDDINGTEIDQKLKPLLHFVKKLTENPSRMVRGDADAVYAAGWDDKALSDAILVCALFNMANRIVDGHGINRATPDWVYEEVGERLSESGYANT